jgi:twinkle protein
MAGQCVEKLVHDHPKCKSESKSLQVFLNDDDTFSGFCFSCHTHVPNPYGDNPPKLSEIHVKTPEEIEEEIAEVRSCGKVDFQHRGLDPDDWAFYGVRLMLSNFDGTTPYSIAHPYTKEGKITGFKIKLLTQKTMWNVGDVKGADLYGWERAKRIGGSTLYITEGEEDAIALRKIMRTLNKGTKYEDMDYACVSLPAGTNNAGEVIGRMANEINSRFKKVVLVFDDDDSGKAAARAVRKIMPEAEVAKLPENDANDCLIKGRLKATRDAVLFNSSKPIATQTLSVDDVLDDILSDPEWGEPYPWTAMTKLTYGQRKKELISIGGGTGCGKTLIGHELAAWNAKNNGWRTLCIMMEETPAETYKAIAGKIDNVPYHVPLEEGAEPYDKNVLRNTVVYLRDYVKTWDISTIEDPETTWEQIVQVLRTEGANFDCVMIDNATTLSEGLNMSERNEFIGKVANEFVKMAEKFDFMAIMFSHLNPPDRSAKSHENGGKVLESQFTGSRALQRYSHMMVGFERNKIAVDPDCSITRLLKNRKFGKTGMFKTYYTQKTGRLQERSWDDELYKDKQVGGKKPEEKTNMVRIRP